MTSSESTSQSLRGWRSFLPSANALLVIAVLNGFILSLGGSALLDSYRQTRDRSVQSAQDLSVALSEGVGGLFDRIDFALLGIGDSFRQSSGPDEMRLLLAGWCKRLSVVDNFWITDASGKVRFGDKDMPGLSEISLGDRDYFIRLRDDPALPMIISKPVVGRITQQWLIVLARRISGPDGSFAGIALASLPVSNVAAMFSALHLGKDGAVALRADDLSVMARFPETVGKAVAVGQTAVSQELQEAVRANPLAGNYMAKAGIDGIERALSYHKIGNRPVTVVVGLATSDTMADWRRGAMPLMAGLAVFALLSFMGGAVISRIWRLRVEAHKRLQAMAAEQERFSEILAHHLQEPVRIQHIFAQRLRTLLPEPLDPEVALALHHVLRGANRQRALLRDVRTFLTLDDLLAAQPASCDAEAALSQLLQKFDPQLQELQAQLIIGELPIAPIGEKPFIILMTSLLENAIQYRSPVRPLSLRIEGGKVGGLVFFAVTDNGLGIPKQYRDRVFNVFERLNPEPDQSGTGIGLAMVRKIVQRSGGRAEITDGEDGGTRVAVYFPASP